MVKMWGFAEVSCTPDCVHSVGEPPGNAHRRGRRRPTECHRTASGKGAPSPIWCPELGEGCGCYFWGRYQNLVVGGRGVALPIWWRSRRPLERGARRHSLPRLRQAQYAISQASLSRKIQGSGIVGNSPLPEYDEDLGMLRTCEVVCLFGDVSCHRSVEQLCVSGADISSRGSFCVLRLASRRAPMPALGRIVAMRARFSAALCARTSVPLWSHKPSAYFVAASLGLVEVRGDAPYPFIISQIQPFRGRNQPIWQEPAGPVSVGSLSQPASGRVSMRHAPLAGASAEASARNRCLR